MFRVSTASFVVIVLLAVTATGFAQTEPRDTRQTDQPATPEERAWQFWLKGNGQIYENFFQAPSGSAQEDVNALFGEIGASVGIASSMRLYGSVNLLSYDAEDLDESMGMRVGLRMNDRPHSFDVYLEQLQDRPTFDVGDEFDTADIRTLAGEYAFRFSDWQLSVDGEMQKQEFEITAPRDNEFSSVGAAVRWRGSRLFSPEIGFRAGERDVDDATLSYDQRETYLQVRSSPSSSVYLSVRYRMRTRDYSTDVLSSSYFGREDDRKQLAGTLDWTFMPRLTLNLYAAQEDVDTNLAGRDFDTGLYLAGLTFRF